MNRYNYLMIEKKWQEKWQVSGTYKTKLTEPRFYSVDIPPDSLSSVHMGHARDYTASDAISRFYRMQGYNVIRPVGSFVLSATGIKAEQSKSNMLFKVKKDLLELGLSYDFNESFDVLESQIHRWSQWLFLELFKQGLVQRKVEIESFCTSCKKYVDKEISDGLCRECGSKVIQKEHSKWFVAVTPYAKRLFENLDASSKLPENIKAVQKSLITKLDDNSYKVRDWLVSDEDGLVPVPLLYCSKCGEYAAFEIPEVSGGKPENLSDNLGTVYCPKCGDIAKKDTVTLNNSFLVSSCLPLLADPERQILLGKKPESKIDVDLLVGNLKKAGLDLLYTRFISLFLYDLGLSETEEPYQRFLSTGIVHFSGQGSKAVALDRMIKIYGADTIRWFLLFSGPLNRDFEWNDDSIEGSYRIITRVWRLVYDVKVILENPQPAADKDIKSDSRIRVSLNQTIKNVTLILREGSQLNSACSLLMEFTNQLQTYLKETEDVADLDLGLLKEAVESLIKMLSPFVPHVASELWEKLGNTTDVVSSSWPSFDPDFIELSEVEVVIQINGTKKAKIIVPKDTSSEDIKQTALGHEKVQGFLDGMEVKKVIVVPRKVVNIVAG